MRIRYDWTAAQRYYDEGHGRDECMERFGFSIVAWYKAVARGDLHAEVSQKRIDWTAVQQFYDTGNSVRDCRAYFGFANESWNKPSAAATWRLVPAGRRLLKSSSAAGRDTRSKDA